MALRTIECLAATDDVVDAIHRILRVIVEETGIQCAGIRLREGDDFPYYAFSGFSREFIQLESSLCLRNSDGSLATDAQGRPALTCLCGRVIRGQTLPDESCFTSTGSFFTPCLQALNVDPAKLGPIRGRCIGEGFQTHALVPLRQGGETIGLLHLSDPNPYMLTEDDVAFLERLGASVGIALAYKQDLEQQRRTDDTYQDLFEKLGWGYALHEMIYDAKGDPVDYATLETNQSFERLLDAPKKTVVGKRASATLEAPELASWLAMFGGVAAGGPSVTYDTYSPHNQKHFYGHAYSLKKGTFAVAFQDVTERNQTRAQLAESEARYRTLVETADDAILLTGLDGKHVFKNNAYYISLGYAPGEPISPEGYDRVHPDDRDRLRPIEATLFERGSAAYEYRVRHKDGHWIWRAAQSRVIRDEFGQPKSFLTVLRDVSVRKQMEAELRESRARLEIALRSSGMGVWHLDIESDRRFFDDQACALLGIDPMTFAGTAEEIFRRIHPDDRPKVSAAIARTLSQDAPFEIEYRVPWKDGSVRHISSRGALVRDQAGKAQRIHGVNWDVTERVRADEALHAVEARVRLTTEALGVGTFRWDFVNGTHEFSPEFLALYGLRPDESLEVGPDLAPLSVLDEDLAAFLEAVATANNPKGSGEVKGEFRVRWPDGSIHWLMAWARTTFVGPPEQRRPGVSVGVLVDITEDKQAQAERQSLQNQLFQAQKMEALGTLAGGIAHDFNNILAAVLGGVELAIMKTDDLGGAQAESIRLELDDVQHAAQRASALVRQILSFSRRNPEDKKTLLVRPLVAEACKFIRSALPATIEIHQALSIDGPVMANPTQIHQVVMNLLTNAGLAMPDGGQLDVELDAVDLDQTFPSANQGLSPGQFVRLTVRDTGCGIPPENLGRIFEPLFTTRSDRRGTGLGLAIVHGIVAEHGGIVTVSSEVGKGTTFEVFLPLHEQPISASVLGERRLPGTERILFVDDEETLVQMAERGLGVLGYQVKGFVSSVEALRAFRAAPEAFDIVVSDLTMPGLTGDVLARELRKLRPDIPVVILTGAAERMTSGGRSASAVDSVLLKPVTVGALTMCLRGILDRK